MAKMKKSAKSKTNGKHAADKKPKGCYVLSLTVENIRCFGPKQTLDCSDGKGRPRQWTVILGDNGTGKTTMLHLPGCITGVGQFIFGSFFSMRESLERGCVNNDYVIGSFTAPSQLQFRYSASVTRKISDIDGAYSWKEDTSCDKRQYLRYWSLFGYSAHRSLRHQRSDLIGTQFISNNELAFSSEPQGLLNVERWLLDLDYAESKSKHVLKSNVYNSVKDVLLNILPSVSGIRCTAGSGHFPRASVEFQTRFGWVSLNKLGHGYQAMIAWMVDFVSRLIERYPDSDDALSEPAICLIDEIDLHLHPVWQRKLISYLSVKFPNTQFIVTAHSPLVVQAAANADANIAVLVRSKEKDADGNYYVEIKNNPEDVKNWRLDQILTSDLFGGISLNPPEVEELFKEKEHLINLKRMKPEQKTRLAEIEEKIGKLPVGDDSREIKEMDAIREAIKVLKKRSAS